MNMDTDCLRIILEYKVAMQHGVFLSGPQGVSMLGSWNHTWSTAGNRCYVEMDILDLLHLKIVSSHRCLFNSYNVVSAIIKFYSVLHLNVNSHM